MYLGFGCSLSIFLYHGAMTSISVTLDEAARMDGANKFQIFWKIIFPFIETNLCNGSDSKCHLDLE